MLTLTPLDDRSAPVAIDVVWSDHPWLTPARRLVIASAFAQWEIVEDQYPAITASGYRVHDHVGRVVDADVAALPDDTLRVWVGVGSTITGGVAETGPVGYVVQGDPLPRVPGWTLTFDSSRVSDTTVSAVALHEAGHVVGLDHQPAETPVPHRTAMYPYADATRSRLTALDYRDLLWNGHKIPAGTVITGIGVQSENGVSGYMVYGG